MTKPGSDDYPQNWSYSEEEREIEEGPPTYQVRAEDGTVVAESLTDDMAELLVRTEECERSGDPLPDPLRNRWRQTPDWSIRKKGEGYDVYHDQSWDDLGKSMTIVIARQVPEPLAKFLCRLQKRYSSR